MNEHKQHNQRLHIIIFYFHNLKVNYIILIRICQDCCVHISKNTISAGLYYFSYFQKRLTYLQNGWFLVRPNFFFNNQTYFSHINKSTDLNYATNVLVSRNGYVILIRIYSFIIFENVTQH